jgi:Tfp pilus assembly protein PilV
MIGACDEAGTSLLEVVVALLLIALGTLAVVPMFVSAKGVNASGADISSLSAKATAQMESLRAEPFHHIVAGGSLTSDVAGYSDTSDPEVVVRWQVVDGGGPAGTKTIRLLAFAVGELSTQASSVELTTLRAR